MTAELGPRDPEGGEHKPEAKDALNPGMKGEPPSLACEPTRRTCGHDTDREDEHGGECATGGVSDDSSARRDLIPAILAARPVRIAVCITAASRRRCACRRGGRVATRGGNGLGRRLVVWPVAVLCLYGRVDKEKKECEAPHCGRARQMGINREESEEHRR